MVNGVEKGKERGQRTGRKSERREGWRVAGQGTPVGNTYINCSNLGKLPRHDTSPMASPQLAKLPFPKHTVPRRQFWENRVHSKNFLGKF